jgi:hypothetical protein
MSPLSLWFEEFWPGPHWGLALALRSTGKSQIVDAVYEMTKIPIDIVLWSLRFREATKKSGRREEDSSFRSLHHFRQGILQKSGNVEQEPHRGRTDA